MNDHELQAFEQQLRQTRPTQPPARLVNLLQEAMAEPEVVALPATGKGRPRLPAWNLWLRRLVPIGAAMLVGLLVWQVRVAQRQPAPSIASLPRTGAGMGAHEIPMTADEVQFSTALVDDFEGVARLPGGEPLRFRYVAFMDKMVLRNFGDGVTVEKLTPRVEVVPVGFETY